MIIFVTKRQTLSLSDAPCHGTNQHNSKQPPRLKDSHLARPLHSLNQSQQIAGQNEMKDIDALMAGSDAVVASLFCNSTEAAEVASSIEATQTVPQFASFDEASTYVRTLMAGQSPQAIDNVAWELYCDQKELSEADSAEHDFNAVFVSP